MNTHEGINYWGKIQEQTIFYWPQEPVFEEEHQEAKNEHKGKSFFKLYIMSVNEHSHFCFN